MEAIDAYAVSEAVSDAVRVRILGELVSSYPRKLTISELKDRLERVMGRSISRTAVSFHLKKLERAGLVELNGSGEGFRAVSKTFVLKFNGDGLKLKEVVRFEASDAV